MQSKIRIDFLHSFMMLYIKAFIKGSWYFNDAQKKLHFFPKQSFSVIKGSSNNPKCGTFAFWNVCVGKVKCFWLWDFWISHKFSQTTFHRLFIHRFTKLSKADSSNPLLVVWKSFLRVWRVLSRLWVWSGTFNIFHFHNGVSEV